MPRISIIIPCRNEEVRLPATLDALNRYFDEGGQDAEVLVVDENSSDGTVAAARARGGGRVRVIANTVARGKGYAVKTGMLQAAGDIVFFMDADLSVPPRFIGEFVRLFDGSVDIIFGSRRHPDSIIPIRQPFLREFCGRLFNAGLRIAGATGVADTQCGFKAFSHEAAQYVFSRLTLDGFGFDVEALAIAETLGFRVREAPVEWNDAEGSKVRPFRDGVTSFIEAARAARRARRVFTRIVQTGAVESQKSPPPLQ